MSLSPRQRKVALAAHVTSSVGWLGAVVAYLGLAIVSLASDDVQTVRSAVVVMEPTVRFVSVPFAFAALVTGLVSSLGTHWGLFRHYWVAIKLLLTAFATLVLFSYAQSISHYADMAAAPIADVSALRNATHAVHSAGALVILLTTTVLGLSKPRGLTRHGRRKPAESRTASAT